MKLSTKIKKYVPAVDLVDTSLVPIVFMVDGKRKFVSRYGHEEELSTNSFETADRWHKDLIENEHFTLLPLNECPVYNGKEVIMHYTSTTYKDWCNLLV